MGNEMFKERLPKPPGSYYLPNLLPLTNIKGRDFNIENLILSGGGPKCFAFAGAVKVLEKIGVLPRITRFTGVGTGAVAAALLAVGYDCENVQKAFTELLQNLIIDDQEGYAYLFPRFVENLGWNNGELFIKWMNRLLELRSTLSDVTFGELYRRTGIELCIIVTNINKMCVEYFHAKTTPDVLIAQAVFTSMSIPGIFYPSRYKFGETESIYTNGSLLCSYPIHCYDGWWLSQSGSDSIPLKVAKASDILSLDHAFQTKNNQSLGFVLLDPYTEADYAVFVKRLIKAGSKIAIPDTLLGKTYKENVFNRSVGEEKYQRLRLAYFRILDLVAYKDRLHVCIDDLAKMVFEDPSLTHEQQNILFTNHCEPVIDCAYLMCELATENPALRAFALRKLLRPKTIEMIDDCINTRKVPVNDLHTLFGALSYISQNASFEVKESDYDRTVGILCGHIGSNDINLANSDEEYLFKQSWNATVAYFQEIISSEKK